MSHYHFATISLPDVVFLTPEKSKLLKEIIISEASRCKHIQILTELGDEICLHIHDDANNVDIESLKEKLRKFYFELTNRESIKVNVGCRF